MTQRGLGSQKLLCQGVHLSFWVRLPAMQGASRRRGGPVVPPPGPGADAPLVALPPGQGAGAPEPAVVLGAGILGAGGLSRWGAGGGGELI